LIVVGICAVIGLSMLVARGDESASPPAAKTAPAAPARVMPPAVNRPVDFIKDVVPIFQSSCVNCHSSGKTKADLSVETREKLIEGGATAPAIEPGNSADSLLIQLVSGLDDDPDRYMPQKGKKLTPEQIGVLRAWIDQGAKWPKGYVVVSPDKPIPAPLEPRQVAIPAGHDGLINPIDLLLVPYFQKHNIKPGKLVSDRVFARRVYLDIIGLLPPPAELDAFASDTSPTKRAQLVHKLLNDKYRYAAHWLSFWNDMLRNDYKGTGYIDGGRLQITRWLYTALAENMPYDEFVRELITGKNGAEGFTKGIVWRGVVNAAQTPQMQAAQNIGQVFMGVNLKCASCHDSFISQWKLTDSYGLAGVYADKPLEMERCNRPLGKTAPMKFLYPQLGTIDANAPREQRIAKLAQIVTNPQNGRLSRTIVNRLWQRFMGRGLIEPVDEMDNKPWDQDILDCLAWDLAKEHFDLKKTIETIVLSNAYQMEAQPAQEIEKEYVFDGPSVKRMSAEQFVDAVATVGNVWPTHQDARLTNAAEQYGKAKWIWSSKTASQGAPAGTIYLRHVINLKPTVPQSALTLIACDNAFVLYVNGKEAVRCDDYKKIVALDLKPYLKDGRNILAVEATNLANSSPVNPAGFWFHLDAIYAQPVNGKTSFSFDSTAKWKVSPTRPSGDDWKQLAFNDKTWQKAAATANVDGAPWRLADRLPDPDANLRPKEIRAAFCAADPLTTALGRPNRDQVNTERPKASSTLMALELTNGATLNSMLDRAAKQMVAQNEITTDGLIDQVFSSALGRKPTPTELSAAKSVIGEKPSQTGVEDFLWAIVMQPEFQLIR
jgi:hypothetical protein